MVKCICCGYNVSRADAKYSPLYEGWCCNTCLSEDDDE